MQIGFVGLGKMGGNMVHRIKRDSDHDVVAFDFNEDAVRAAEEHGAQGASSLEDLEIPGERYTFATLIRAQADGDLQTLRNHGLPAVRVSVGDIDAIKEQL